MLIYMRLTFSVDNQLASRVNRAAAEEGLSVNAFIAKTQDDALIRRDLSRQQPFRLVTALGGKPRRGVDLDRPRSIDSIEDELQFGPHST